MTKEDNTGSENTVAKSRGKLGAITENPSLCYQCGKCSAGCPVAEEMDILPHRLMHYLGLGMEDKALRSNTIWMCAGCFTCAVRCPNDIDITSVMDGLREEAIKSGIPCPKPNVMKFHRTFLGDVARRGRVHELRMMGEYNLRSGDPLHNAQLAPKMLLRRRLHILPPKRIKGFKSWLKKLMKKT
jgi:heterodisulfide reductase subunit C2